MAFSHLLKKDRAVGVDIGSAYIKVMAIEPSGSGFRVTRAAVIPTPADACRDGLVSDISAVAGALKDALRKAEMQANTAIAAVSGSQVLVRHVQVPKMAEAVLRKSIRFEAAKYISSGVDDCLVEFEIINPDTGDGQMQVMLVAAPRDLVESKVAVIEAAGLEPTVVDVEAFALMRSLVEFSLTAEVANATVALVDMGAGHTDLNIVSAGRFALTRNIPIAGNSLTQAIKSMTGVDDHLADELKQKVRIGPIEDQDDEPDENVIKAARAIQPLLDELLREIRRSLHYYQSQFPEGSPQAQVNRLLLSGGTSRMAGLPEYISARLNVRAERINLLTDGTIASGSLDSFTVDQEGPLYPVSIGLALKNFTAPKASSAPAPVKEAPEKQQKAA